MTDDTADQEGQPAAMVNSPEQESLVIATARISIRPEPVTGSEPDGAGTEAAPEELGWFGAVLERTVVAAIQTNAALLGEAGTVARRLAARLDRDQDPKPDQ